MYIIAILVGILIATLVAARTAIGKMDAIGRSLSPADTFTFMITGSSHHLPESTQNEIITWGGVLFWSKIIGKLAIVGLFAAVLVAAARVLG